MSGEPRVHYTFGRFMLDSSEHRLLHDGQVVNLTPKVFDLLFVLVKNNGHLVRKEDLLAEVWPDSFVEEASLSRTVSVLRKVLDDDVAEEKYIETIPKRGYRFVAPVVRNEPVPPPPPPPARRAATPIVTIGFGILLIVGAVGYRLAERDRPGPVSPVVPTHTQITFTGKEGLPSISPDGKYVAYISDASPERKLMIRDLNGGVPVQLWSAPELGNVRWSPDGSELLFFARGAGHNGIFLLSIHGGSPRELKRSLFKAAWSPDGSTIAVPEFGKGKIALVNKVSLEEKSIELMEVRRWVFDIDWSPVNNRIVFVANDLRNHFVMWTIRADGTDQRKVIEDDMEIASVRWAPDGQAVYYLRRMDGTWTLFRISTEPAQRESGVTPLPVVTGLQTDGSFAISYDGRRLVYTRAPYHSNLAIVRGGERPDQVEPQITQLTHGTVVVERPSVSPDGKWIVFNAGREPFANLYVMPATGGPARQLTFFKSFNVGGVWSADGKQIAFGSNEGGTNRVWVINSAGGSPQPLSSGQLSDSFDITWAPGREIVYQGVGNRNYYLLDRQGNERKLITDDSVGWAFSPSYSKQGNRIAIRWNRPPESGIWLFDEEGRRQTLAQRALPYELIGWSSDGKSVLGVDGKRAAYRGLATKFGETTTEFRIVSVPLNGGTVHTLLQIPFAEVGGVSMTPDGRNFICTVYSSLSDVWLMENFGTSQN